MDTNRQNITSSTSHHQAVRETRGTEVAVFVVQLAFRCEDSFSRICEWVFAAFDVD